MLDHVFTDAIGALRDAFTNAFLERQAFEEHLHSDVLLGDLVWATSYGLPGEGQPPRVVAHITFTWPSWSQATYRAWYVEEIYHEAPVIEMEIVFRVQRLVSPVDAAKIAGVAPLTSPRLGSQQLTRESISSETISATDTTRPTDHAAEVVYHGAYELAEATLADGTNKLLDEHFGSLGGWVASTLVKLGDLQLTYHPADDDK
ncbi:MAG: hypothetical protein ACKO97_09170 [Actinomycetota bacterium]|nr:hypothetical protein [Actinomycetota bacterium]